MIGPKAAFRSNTHWIGWLGVAAIAAVIFGLPVFLDQGVPLRRKFKEQSLRALEEARPRGVLIGDSMLGTRIDEPTLNAIAGERWMVLAQPGGSSAVWFLMMKNLIAAQSAPPRTVIIFFRDRQLTLPAHRTGSGYRKTIESYMRGDEPRVEALLRAATGGQQSALERLSMAVYPAQWRREAWQEKLQRWSLDLVATSREYGKIRDDTEAIFDLRNLRQDSGLNFEREEGGLRGLDPDEHEFAGAVEESFLPPILEIAREKDIELIFFRVKRLPLSEELPAKESATYPAYKMALQDYLEKGGAKLVDETRDTDVTLKFYGADDHIAPAMMKSYTELFWQKMAPHLGPAGRSEPAR